MPARVEYRLGSIFDEECDILVIPSSAGGKVTPAIAKQLRKAGLELPRAMTWGNVSTHASPNPRYRMVAYAAALWGKSSTAGIVREVANSLGSAAKKHRLVKIAAPLVGFESVDLAPAVAAKYLEQGFLQTAPEGAVLTIHVHSASALKNLVRNHPLPVRGGEPTLHPASRQAGSPTRPITTEPEPPPAAPATRERKPARARPAHRIRTRVFISYSHADAEWLDRLRKHLRPLERGGAMIWADTRIKAGAQWRDEIRAALAETKVAVLLVSADFMASEFIVTDELPPLLKAAEEDGATILPVIISPSRFDRTESLSRFQAVNDPAKPLVAMRRGNREKVLDQVARAVEDALGK
jgi:hypothetical protein